MECKCEEEKKDRPCRHSNISYMPYKEKRYDEWLCEDYWIKINWMPPLDEEEMSTVVGRCNFMCCHKSHPQEGEGMSFCEK
jgi:hypothetical protein